MKHYNVGKNNPMYGKKAEKHPNWKGGKENSKLRKKEYLRQYYLKNKKKINDHNKKYNKENKKSIKANLKHFIVNNNDKWLWYSIKNRCYKKDIILSMTKEEFCNWYNKQIRKCHYCEITEKKWKRSKDSLLKRFYKLQIDRKCPEKGYKISNIVLACPRCNIIKSNRFTEKQMRKIGRIIREAS